MRPHVRLRTGLMVVWIAALAVGIGWSVTLIGTTFSISTPRHTEADPPPYDPWNGWEEGNSPWLQSLSDEPLSSIDRHRDPIAYTEALLRHFAAHVKVGMTLDEAAEALGYPEWGREVLVSELSGMGAQLLPLTSVHWRGFRCTFRWLPESELWNWELRIAVSGIGDIGGPGGFGGHTDVNGEALFSVASEAYRHGLIEAFRIDSAASSDCFDRDGVHWATKRLPFPTSTRER